MFSNVILKLSGTKVELNFNKNNLDFEYVKYTKYNWYGPNILYKFFYRYKLWLQSVKINDWLHCKRTWIYKITVIFIYQKLYKNELWLYHSPIFEWDHYLHFLKQNSNTILLRYVCSIMEHVSCNIVSQASLKQFTSIIFQVGL